MTAITVGDRVCYSAKFLRAIADYSAKSANRQARVKSARASKAGVILSVAWDESLGTEDGMAANFIRADEKHLEPA